MMMIMIIIITIIIIITNDIISVGVITIITYFPYLRIKAKLPLYSGAVASNSVVAESTAQCGVPSVTPNVPEIDQVANYVENLAKSVDSTGDRLVRHGNVIVRQGRPAVFPVLNVAGGSVSVAHSWPWQISMNVYGMHFCGGVILHRRWILTAAHCAYVTLDTCLHERFFFPIYRSTRCRAVSRCKNRPCKHPRETD